MRLLAKQVRALSESRVAEERKERTARLAADLQSSPGLSYAYKLLRPPPPSRLLVVDDGEGALACASERVDQVVAQSWQCVYQGIRQTFGHQLERSWPSMRTICLLRE
eukprot:3437565-Alexandrium_andersonii.AAC.1